MSTTPLRARRGRLRTGVVGAVAGAALLLGACGDDGDVAVERDTGTDAGSESAAALFAASDQTAAVETGRMRMSMEISGTDGAESMPIAMTAEGQFDHGAGLSSMEIDMGELVSALAPLAGSSDETFPQGPQDLRAQQVIDGTTIYMRFDGVAVPGFPAGWISMDAGQAPGADGDSTWGTGSPFGSLDGPGGLLAGLQEAGATVDDVSDDTIDGEAVTRYEGTIDLEAAMGAASPEEQAELDELLAQSRVSSIPFTAWVDDDGVVRRTEVQMSMGDMGGIVMTMAMELYDLGAPVDIQVPPASEVTPVDPSTMGAGMGGWADVA